MRLLQRLRLQMVVSELVEIATEREAFFAGCPYALQGANELVRSAVTLAVLEPPLPNGCKFAFEPARYDVDGDAAVGVVVDGRKLLCGDSGVPRTGEDRSDDFYAGRVVQ
jgi:hypothetical protein